MKSQVTSLPKALHLGQFLIGDVKLDCAVLSNGMRVLSATSIYQVFGSFSAKNCSRLVLSEETLYLIFASKNLKSYINQNIINSLIPITYFEGRQRKIAYIASLLPKLCELYLTARRNGDLHITQLTLVNRSEILLSTLAQVGITSLIDEATGYQHDRKHEALRMLLSKYIAVELHKMLDFFPDSFFSELDWLYCNNSKKTIKRPQIYADFINKYILETIEAGFVKYNFNLTIRDSDGKYKVKFYQWISHEGKNILINKIIKVQELMEMFSNIHAFKIAAAKQKLILIELCYFNIENRKVG